MKPTGRGDGISSSETKDPSRAQMAKNTEKTHPMVHVVFASLLLDLLAFTMILPLLPSLLDLYSQHDSSGLYPYLIEKVRFFQNLVGAPDRFNSVLFGGFLGSMFSFLQFVASPMVGGFSDAYGRKSAMLLCLTGIAFSYILWVLSSNFALFVVARFVGGISKGNVSLSMAIITDVSTPAARAKGMALVGIAFSIGFILGPIIGAGFARWSHSQTGGSWFMVPASFALFLACTDLLFVFAFFKETLPKEKRAPSVAKSLAEAVAYVNPVDLFQFKAVQKLPTQEHKKLVKLGVIYYIYLFLYSGLEFTLTFLTHHTFGYTSMQQGWMFFAIGLTMAILQGAFVRRIPPHHVASSASLGLLLIVPSFVCVGLASSSILLYVGLLLFAVSTSMVVPCMMTLVSKFGTHDQKGTVMGIFRSLGALARATGPIFASILYWSIGSVVTYLLGGVLLLVPWLMMRNLEEKLTTSPQKQS
ncbi:major facilitator superfamily domain-containing protein 10 [Ischnura elegans]|uniref:major facilitator superfamily domain-containing protein 10 n=1 Tax=Ischnura elegans TaxID=197161 RepID=UPI001ED8A593|nr:major facilitator superfamily domain-containing protein 10 [Ischnura elegans]XP_046387006.1 major facilitator superfamily domain-containing protein 10 [Ischnura elegans]